MFVLDADGLIKLAKSSVIKRLLQRFSCFISDKVYEEVVVKGKRRLYEDAFIIEDLVKSRMLKVKETKENPEANLILHGKPQLGVGERSTLHLFFNLKAKAVISDDKAFLKVLSKHNIPFITPSNIIVSFVELGIMTRKEGLRCLNILKPYVSKETYLRARRIIEGGG